MKNYFRLIYFFIFINQFSINHLQAQQTEKSTASGYVKDSKNGEKLIGVNVYIKGTTTGTTTNEYGFYSLTLPKGKYELVASYIGYSPLIKEIDLSAGNVKMDFEIVEQDIQLQEVVVKAEADDQNIKGIEMSVNKLDIKTIQKIPAFLGEVDVIRSIQLLPGVATVGEGATGFNVRGGAIDQNLVLLDEAPVYNSAHLFGFFSVFNPDAVKDVKLIKGGIPAQYGGRLSSLLDVRMKEGNSKRFEMNGGIGAIFSRLSIEAPIVKDKASFIVAARRSYIDVLAKPFLSSDLRGSQFYFYDLTAKVNYTINPKNTVFVSGYFGRDVFGSGFKFNWGNATSTVRWNHLFSDRLFMNLTAFYSNYDYEIGFKDDVNRSRFDWNSNIINYSVKPDFTYFLNTKNTIKFGAQSILYDFRPGNAVITSNDIKSDISLDPKYALESGFYIDNEQKIGEKLTLQYGFRYSTFQYMGKGEAYEFGQEKPNTRRPVISVKSYDQWETIQNYGNFEPRFSMNLELNATTSLKASYNRMVQYLHLVSNTAAATPVDVWTPSTNNIKPQLADQFAVGLFKNFQDNTYETSVEVYYKDMQNQLDFIDNSDLLLNRFLEGDLLQGIGRAYGAELYVKKNKGKLTGWISYTLSRTERQVEGLNNGNWFPNRYDRPHNLNTSVSYEFNEYWSASANFVLQSGTPVTFPTSRVQVQDYVIPYNVEATRNNFRVPTYHRLDFSVTKINRKKKPNQRWESNWVFSVYNAYNRRNPFTIYFRRNQDVPLNTEAVRLAIIGSIVPAVSYNFKF
ncbi:TonB-dependent receptor [Thermoflexibacter ruber]|uniref:Outer membrane receptor proteins, mostly Fe transport n=1 Tax=Thermoflexibacter ruber TaxID=1003 RepID=A0A1I2DYV6_9BACT|nr:TonB-dependent receptor [Thermoflexibacter ruber]SFE85578.1 Outer membrane receptor proteins, mostly Fe transport [Thermoflexibacter ruber]